MKLLRSCQPGVLLVTFQASSGILYTNGPRLPVHVRCLICIILAFFFADSVQTCSRTRIIADCYDPSPTIIADCYDPSPTACLTMPCHSVLIWAIGFRVHKFYCFCLLTVPSELRGSTGSEFPATYYCISVYFQQPRVSTSVL